MIQLVVRVGREHADLVLAELMAFSPGGLEERQAGDAIEYVLYGAAGELPELGHVRATVAGRAIDVSTCELPDGWGEDWRSFHQPHSLGYRGGGWHFIFPHPHLVCHPGGLYLPVGQA